MNSSLPQTSRLRILHVVGGMRRAGTETWLLHVLRHIDRGRFAFDFLVHSNETFAYEREITELGGRIIPCLSPHRPWTYASNFRRVLTENGPYDVVHSHMQHFNGIALRLARRNGVPIRIAHSHHGNANERVEARFTRRIYLALADHWIRQCATGGLGCSAAAATALFGPEWTSDPRWQIHHCGLDLSSFSQPTDVSATRAELGVPENALVIGHVGRLEAVKNHSFLVDVVATLVERRADPYVVLVGEGTLKSSIAEKVRSLELQDRFIFVGSRSDVPRLLKVMDVMVFPSFSEGLGLALIEAQAAGTPCVCSEGIPREADVVPELMWRRSLRDSPDCWADAVRGAAASAKNIARGEALRLVQLSPFNVRLSVTALEQFYAAACHQSAAA